MKKFIYQLLFVFISAGILFYYNNMSKSTILTKSSSLNSNSPVITVKKVLNEIEKNKLRATEKYNNNSHRIIGVMFNTDKQGSDYRVIVTADWDSTVVLYAIIPAKYKDAVLAVNSNQLVSMVCTDLQEFGMHSVFKNCDFFEKVDTKGVRNSVYLNEIIIKEESAE